MISTNGYIRFATKKDMKTIHNWLIRQDKDNVYESFLCNWNLTKEVYDKENIFVYIDNETDESVAYMWPNFGIVEVRGDKRKQGLGSILVDFGIKYAIESGVTAIKIECAPITSVPFWRKMGFVFYTDKHAYFLLNKEHSFPDVGNLVSVYIRFYPECKNWKPETAPLKIFSQTAMKTPEGNIYLKNRISIFKEDNWGGDPVIEINIDGKLLYLDKAKYPVASKLGIKNELYTFSIDRLYTAKN